MQQLHQVEPAKHGGRVYPSPNPNIVDSSHVLSANNLLPKSRVILKIGKQPSASLQLGAQS